VHVLVPRDVPLSGWGVVVFPRLAGCMLPVSFLSQSPSVPLTRFERIAFFNNTTEAKSWQLEDSVIRRWWCYYHAMFASFEWLDRGEKV
jgi:hypothetical protein